jgi:hypothetical protein
VKKDEKHVLMTRDANILRKGKAFPNQQIASAFLLARSSRVLPRRSTKAVEPSGLEEMMLKLAFLTGVPGETSFRREPIRIADARETKDGNHFSLLVENGWTGKIANGMRRRGSLDKARSVEIQNRIRKLEPGALARGFHSRNPKVATVGAFRSRAE